MLPPRFDLVDAPSPEGAVPGRLSSLRVGGQTWFGDDRIGYLIRDNTAIKGRWRQAGELWHFVPATAPDVPFIRAFATWSAFDSYWGERAALVIDRSVTWTWTRFEPIDAVAFKVEGGEMHRRRAPGDADDNVVAGGWDHEHCQIDGEKIGFGGTAAGFKSNKGDWVCEQCYKDFVNPRSLLFATQTSHSAHLPSSAAPRSPFSASEIAWCGLFCCVGGLLMMRFGELVVLNHTDVVGHLGVLPITVGLFLLLAAGVRRFRPPT